MSINQEQRNKLWLAFLRVYDKSLSRTEMKRAYSRAASILNIRGCTPCQVNGTFNEFIFNAEDLSEAEIKNILNPSIKNMPTVKPKKTTVSKKSTTAVTKKKKPAKAPKVTTPKAKAPKVTTPKATLPGGLKFLYIPKRR